MATLYVARSARLGKWAFEVGLGKHIYKVGVTDEPVKKLVAAGWAGETDWQLVKQQPAELAEADALERLAKKEKAIDPRYYPRIREAPGLFKVDPVHVENHMLVTRALAGEASASPIKLKPADFAAYLIHNATR